VGDVSTPVAGRPVVAIVGRPNVGKSTLMNRILGRREAIVEKTPGVTRDRKSLEAEWQGIEFLLTDTGGWMADRHGDELDAKVSRQAEQAMADADVVLFVVDGTIGLTSEDDRVARLLQRRKGPVLVVVNKLDHDRRNPDAAEFWSLGLGQPYPISALHGRGTGDLLDAIVAELPEAPAVDPGTAPAAAVDADVTSVALVGRPNVGKSTLFNRLIGSDRSVVHDRPGTTRDTIDTEIDTELGRLRFIDTAGMRRKAKVDEATEYYSSLRALDAVDEADVALLIIDANEGVTGQDQRLAERVAAAGCPVVVLMNKWDVLPEEAVERVERSIARRLHFLADAPVLKISALTGKGVHRLMEALEHGLDAYHTRVPTRAVNEVIRAAQSAHPAPDGARVMYATQGATEPPTFTLFATRRIPKTYIRYLERRLREEFDLGRTPLKMRVRLRGRD
jgi:GTP-binding protein